MPDPITHGKVVGRVLLGKVTAPQTQPLPEYTPMPSAVVEFKALLPEGRMKALMQTDQTSVFLRTFLADTDDKGYLRDPAGNRGIMLPSSVDPSLGYSEWVWRMTIVTPVAAPIVQTFILPPFTKAGDEVDITTLTPIPAEPGRELAQWEALYLRVVGVRQRVQEAGATAIAEILEAQSLVEQYAIQASIDAVKPVVAPYATRAEAAAAAAKQSATDSATSASSAAAARTDAAASATAAGNSAAASAASATAAKASADAAAAAAAPTDTFIAGKVNDKTSDTRRALDAVYPSLEGGVLVQSQLPFAVGVTSVVTTTAGTPATVSVSFGKTFKVGPAVFVTPITGVPGTQVTGVAVTNVTTTGCDLVLTRTTTGTTGLCWIAAEKS